MQMPKIDIDAQLEALKAATVMMVDDEPTTIDVLEAFLEGEGYSQFVTTSDSRQALELVETERPDILLLDLMMPHVDGLEILSSIRNHAEHAHLPVIILTSSTDASLKLEALELGATDFLAKPVDPSELALRMRNTLAAKAHRDRLAYFDSLTDLPNRRSFMERLERILPRVIDESTQCVVLHLVLDRFKQINETLGHGTGDALLRVVADRMQQCLRTGDFLARTGSGEFSLLLPGGSTKANASRIAQRLVSSLTDPISIEGQDLFVTPNVGIALFPHDAEDGETLLANAGIAMSHAKSAGTNHHCFYSKALNADSSERMSLANQLPKAIERDELFFVYQPTLDVQTGQIVGVEALMRWRHPERGLIFPARFIPIAEEAALIEPLGEWALRAACQQNKAWQDAGFDPIRVFVNVSAAQFRTGKLQRAIRGALEHSGLDPKYLALELTESLIMDNPEDASETLYGIKQMGLEVVVDDFGTGYSSLSYLKRFPLDGLKIDRSFIKGVPHDDDDAAIVTATIGIAHALGLMVVAEGVEKEEQLAFLEERGCDVYQGYLVSPPVEAADLAGLFRRESEDR